MNFIPRLSRPQSGNKYYITKSQGGYSDAVQGQPTDPYCNVLPNCVGYAYGRFNEIGNYGYCKYLRPVNAENFMVYKGSLEVGQTPKLGACMVWQKGATLNDSDGAGHVAIVEKIINDSQIITSESGWGSSKPFWTQNRAKGDGNWGMNSAYHFLGFIYNPVINDENNDQSKKEDNMSNSSLVSYTKISPNRSTPRNHKIDTITIHCVVGQCSVETLGNIFSNSSASASANYGIGPDGRIGMYVEEQDRSWCSSSSSNDNRAVTIEVASDTTHPYAVTDAAYDALIELCADICRRNGIAELKWKADKNLIGQIDQQNMTVHRWFANKACPGDYLYSRHSDIAAKVNAKLGANPPSPIEPETPADPSGIQAGDIIKLRSGATYISGQRIPNWVINSTLYARQIRDNGDIVFSTRQSGAITGVIHANQLEGGQPSGGSAPPQPSQPEDTNFLVKVTDDALNIRKGPGVEYGITGVIRNHGVYTIVQTQSGWGKLKSGIGWISLNYTKRL